ncbi:hypothetical protein NC651_004104 [Populus alba x Populus x berolinensis]|nr:hypothetical protein NC651_004104 [Populus alba x Populus x berolinensis]
MEAVCLMLRGEGAFPRPKQPGFWLVKVEANSSYFYRTYHARSMNSLSELLRLDRFLVFLLY